MFNKEDLLGYFSLSNLCSCILLPRMRSNSWSDDESSADISEGKYLYSRDIISVPDLSLFYEEPEVEEEEVEDSFKDSVSEAYCKSLTAASFDNADVVGDFDPGNSLLVPLLNYQSPPLLPKVPRRRKKRKLFRNFRFKKKMRKCKRLSQMYVFDSPSVPNLGNLCVDEDSISTSSIISGYSASLLLASVFNSNSTGTGICMDEISIHSVSRDSFSVFGKSFGQDRDPDSGLSSISSVAESRTIGGSEVHAFGSKISLDNNVASEKLCSLPVGSERRDPSYTVLDVIDIPDPNPVSMIQSESKLFNCLSEALVKVAEGSESESSIYHIPDVIGEQATAPDLVPLPAVQNDAKLLNDITEALLRVVEDTDDETSDTEEKYTDSQASEEQHDLSVSRESKDLMYSVPNVARNKSADPKKKKVQLVPSIEIDSVSPPALPKLPGKKKNWKLLKNAHV